MLRKICLINIMIIFPASTGLFLILGKITIILAFCVTFITTKNIEKGILPKNKQYYLIKK